jgi:protein phosphatase
MADNGDTDTVEVVPAACADVEPPQPYSSLVQVDLGALSHTGKVRPNNEDHYLVLRSGRSLDTLRSNLPAGLVAAHYTETGYGMVVADGMGGMAAGEVASSMAITIAVNLCLNNPRWAMRITDEVAREQMEILRKRISQIDCVLTERAKADPALAGMGTTLTGAYSLGADLFIFHIGDSRAYLFRNGRLYRRTRDHTLAQTLADSGIISTEDVPTHRLRHVLTRSLGNQRGEVEGEIQHLQLVDGDRLLLCTDGLTEMVEDAKIAEILGRIEGSESACHALVDRALEAGGKDNVTVVLARYSLPEGLPG